ncbi:hypothetical protein PAT01_03460 [Pseudoalteromonas atlantica]|uniref:Uncharacterized protein n=2 Tax=Pseudoalteromonas TaxID=53246 RepID=A0ACA8DVN6_9GAMM|nr:MULTISPECIES: hypothetical protein [Pseudoalteromonas]ATC82257.1 hypothetical protein PAGA_a1909 [Pseudoalteromonas agarivorans DSM 14585]TMO05146.1 hypothetical protein CWB60_14395 [Pseudoalteromonas sp. S327]TMO20352.1 hypothetical protein CWB59_00840 [Pseudoalteromonas sp. S326]GEK75042.1 hypothetical protein PAT01_03460 [Pseudoalteromonas atlantica]|tara:strand:+ start:1929 stop:2369 length:441 start_codon:yes stop_codon:yes gene_type:complete
MFKKVIISLPFLFSCAHALAAEPNVKFNAKNNQADIFIEKCQLWRNAMRDDNKEVMWSFVEEKYKGTLKPKMAKKMEKVASRHRARLSQAGAYIKRDEYLSTEVPKDVAQVFIDWDNDGKGGQNIGVLDSCVFELLPGTTKWVLDI